MISGVDENRRAYSLKAPGPGGSGSVMRLPGRGTFPNVDDHLVEPEVTRDEIIGGRRVVASPAETAHADQHSRLDYVLQAHVAAGYRVSVDLITRHGPITDFASDACVRREGIDPATGRRHLEEIAFEVVSEQRERLATEKAEHMRRRGVRRIFAVWVKSGGVGEWSAEDRAWRRLDADATIEDPCLVKPLEVGALLNAAIADNAVAEALVAKGNPVILGREAAAETRGVAKSVLEVLEARAVPVTEAQRQQVLRCQDLERLSHWLRRAVTASSAAEVLAEP